MIKHVSAFLATSIFFIAFPVLASRDALATTYYIDYVSGVDSANGTSKTSPWKHAPGMQGCSGTCGSTGLRPGDSVIFKGGVTWDHTNFTMNISWSGSSGNPIYFGVDQTWYSGGSWARPIFSGDHTHLANGSSIINIDNRSYVTIDNIELKSLTAYSNWGPSSIAWTCSTYVTYSHLYVHDWALDSSVSNDDLHGGIFGNSPSCSNVGTVIDHSVISNSEQSGIRQNGGAVRATDVQYSVIHDVATAQLFGRVHDSLLYNVSYPSGNASFDSTYHTNVTYLQWGDNSIHTGTDALFFIYNNIIHDFSAGSGGIYLDTCATSTDASYVWNNIVYNNYSGGNTDVQIDPYGYGSGCGFFYLWNNTFQGNPIRVVNRGFPIGTLVMQNNHYIADGTVFSAPGGVNNLTNNFSVTQTNAQATGQGYTQAETFVYSPVSGGVATVGAGTNLTAKCSGTLAALCTDTTYAVSVNPSNNTVISNPRATNGRPSSGAWDAGAYEYIGVGGPAPPTNLTAAPQ